MNNLFRFCRILISLILAASLLTGCGANSGEPPGNTTKTDAQTNQDTLTFRITWKTYSGRGEAISRIVDAYNAENQTAYQVVLADGDEDLAAIEALIDQEGTVTSTCFHTGSCSISVIKAGWTI